jgi:hypothetical protein
MSRKPNAQDDFTEVYAAAKRSIQEATKTEVAKRREAVLETAIEELSVEAFEAGVQWALQREWTEREKYQVLGK